MISFTKEPDRIVATYSSEYNNDSKWVEEDLESEYPPCFNKTYTFTKDQLIPRPAEEDANSNIFNDPEEYRFVFATFERDYYKVVPGVLTDKINVYLSPEVKLSKKLFVAEKDVSVFSRIEDLIDEDVYIGGNHPEAIPQEAFLSLVKLFPTPHELRLYVQARVSAGLSAYFTSAKDFSANYERYINKKATLVGRDILKTFQEAEQVKYQTIHDKLTEMLDHEDQYNEKQWEREILQIIRLLYPKYIQAFTSVPIPVGAADNIKGKQLDFLLVDNNGNVDLVEIKKPSGHAIISEKFYRDNYIPLRELSGAVMQLEKYIYYLNRWGARGEKYLTQRFKVDLPDGFQIKITNPGGLIIMGRENTLNPDQKMDFEVIKRKYKNVVDIITYDNLLARLKFTIEQIRKL